MSLSRPATRTTPLLTATLLLSGCLGGYHVPVLARATAALRIAPPGPGVGEVELQLHRGYVLISSGDAIRCSGTAIVHAGDPATAQRQVTRVSVVTERVGDLWRLRPTHATGAALDAVATEFRLEVPDDVAVRVHAQDARIAIRGHAGRNNVRTRSGSILARPGGGELVLETDSGGIRLEGRWQRATIGTASGRVEVELPDGRPPQSLRLESDTGTMLVEMDPACRMNLRYVTGGSPLRCWDFPVAWSERRPSAGGDETSFTGVVGEAAGTAAVDTRVRTRAGVLEIRQRPSAPARPER